MRKTWKKKIQKHHARTTKQQPGNTDFSNLSQSLEDEDVAEKMSSGCIRSVRHRRNLTVVRQNICEILALRSPPPAVYQDLSTCHDWSIKCRFVNQNKRNPKRISGSLSLGAASQTLLKLGFMGSTYVCTAFADSTKKQFVNVLECSITK